MSHSAMLIIKEEIVIIIAIVETSPPPCSSMGGFMASTPTRVSVWLCVGPVVCLFLLHHEPPRDVLFGHFTIQFCLVSFSLVPVTLVVFQ